MTAGVDEHDDDRPPALRSPLRAAATLALAAIGFAFWRVMAGDDGGTARQQHALAITLAVAALLLIFGPIRRSALRTLDGLRQPDPFARRFTAVLLATLAGLYVFHCARQSGRELAPVIHDEYCYALQARMLTEGRLWLPRHELAESFESFHLITDTAYGPKYSPGTAIFQAAGMTLGAPGWLTSLVLSAVAAGLLYLLLTHWIDGLAGIAGVAMLVSVPAFRRMGTSYMSQPPMLFLLLLAFWAYGRWRVALGRGWLLLLSAAVGMAAITRPLDAAALGLILAPAVLARLYGHGVRAYAATTALGLLVVAPFLGLQVAMNRGLTGDWATLPWKHYADRDDPYDTMGSPPLDPALRPVSTLPQKREFAETFTRDVYAKASAEPFARRFGEAILPWTLADTLPFAPLLALIPVGLITAGRRGRWALWLFLPAFALGYARYTFYLPHYAIVAAPAAILAVTLGVHAISRSATLTAHRPIVLALWPGVIAVTLTALPEFSAAPRPAPSEPARHLRDVDRRLADLGGGPAIVLFKYAPGVDCHAEPVYNIDAASPDDARVIRAHQRGPRIDARLFDYYAKRSPGRACYMYDRAATGEPLRYLGTAGGLAREATTAAADVREP